MTIRIKVSTATFLVDQLSLSIDLWIQGINIKKYGCETKPTHKEILNSVHEIFQQKDKP